MSEARGIDWFFFFPFLWIGGWIAASVIYRRIHGKPIFPRAPEGAIYKERMASGANTGHWLGRIGGANRCLIVAVTGRELVVTPYFPFNLMFLPEIYGLEVRTPLSRIRKVEDRRWFFRDSVVVEFDEGQGMRLILRDPAAFKRALGQG